MPPTRCGWCSVGGRLDIVSLIEIKTLIPNIVLDLRYASVDNVVNTILYSTAKAYLQKEACEALVRVQKDLYSQGLGLIIWDSYRPYSVTKRLWDLAPLKNKELTFANPLVGSIHNKGCAIDVTLLDRNTGLELAMPSKFDDNTDKARPAYADVTPEIATRREILKTAFVDNGFIRDEYEWWHFNWKYHEKYQIIDIPIEDLR